MKIICDTDSDALTEISKVNCRFVGLLVRHATEDNPNQVSIIKLVPIFVLCILYSTHFILQMAADFYLSMWSHELSQAMNTISQVLANEDLEISDRNKAQVFQQSLQEAVKLCCFINEQASSTE